MPTEPLPDLSRPHRTGSWRAWIILWLSLLVCETVLLSNNAHLDTLTWRSTRWFVGDRDKYTWADYHAAHLLDPAPPFYQHDPPPFASHFYKHTQRFWEVMKTFGEPWFALLVVLLIATYNPRRWRSAATAGIAIALSGGAGALIQAFDGRYRPINNDGANVWIWLRGLGFYPQAAPGDFAHPSGHATAAFATAAVLCYLSPRGRPIFITAAALCAISRVVMGAHFWSDAILGGVLGWSIAWWICVLADRLSIPNTSGASLENTP